MLYLGVCKQGLIEAILSVFPNAFQKSCCQCIWMNFFKKFGDGGLRNFFWQAASAGTREVFHKAMMRIKEQNKAAYEYPAGWSLAHGAFMLWNPHER